MSGLFAKHRRWIVLFGLMLIYAATNGIIVHTLPLIYPALIDEFGWSTAQITLPATVFYIFGAVTSPPAGVLLDKFSPRKIMLCGIAGLVLSLFAFALVSKLWQMVVVFFCFGLFMSLTGLTASMVVLAKWFNRTRGRAIGLLLMASSIGGAIFPLIVGAGLESDGWRSAINMVAVVAVVMTLPSIIFLVMDKPIDVAKTDLTAMSEPSQPTVVQENQFAGPSLREAVTKPTFYLIAFATACIWFSIIALVQHQSIHLVKDIGVERALLPKVFSLFFACSVVGKLSFGWLGDYLNKELTLILSVATFVCGLLILRSIGADDSNMLFAYAVVAGIGFSGAFTTIQLLIAHHYSGASYGKILAILVMIDSLAGGMGTRVIANIRDTSDSYIPAIDTLVSLCVVAIICIFIIRLLKPELSTTKHQSTNINKEATR